MRIPVPFGMAKNILIGVNIGGIIVLVGSLLISRPVLKGPGFSDQETFYEEFSWAWEGKHRRIQLEKLTLYQASHECITLWQQGKARCFSLYPLFYYKTLAHLYGDEIGPLIKEQFTCFGEGANPEQIRFSQLQAGSLRGVWGCWQESCRGWLIQFGEACPTQRQWLTFEEIRDTLREYPEEPFLATGLQFVDGELFLVATSLDKILSKTPKAVIVDWEAYLASPLRIKGAYFNFVAGLRDYEDAKRRIFVLSFDESLQ